MFLYNLYKNITERKNHLSKIFSMVKSKIIENTADTLRLELKINELTNFALHSTSKGVTSDKICNEEVIVSLTTHGSRYYDCYLAIESIMQGTVKPNKIVLWVGEELKDTPIPVLLQNQMKRGLEIRYRRDIRSYTKLIYALKEFPNAVIITVDDDILYSYDVVENLTTAHNKYAGCICANVVHYIPKDLNTNYQSLLKWDFVRDYHKQLEHSLFEGFSGVLYSPNSLNTEVFNESVFMEICKYADDVWFSAMAMLQKTKVIYSYPHAGLFNWIETKESQLSALQNINSKGEVLNDKQVKAVFSRYKLCGF